MTKDTIDIRTTKLTNHVPTQLPTDTGTTVHNTLWQLYATWNACVQTGP